MTRIESHGDEVGQLPAATAPAAAEGFLQSMSSGLARLVTIARRRREVAELLELDDRLLADMGLSRTDVRSALSLGWQEDPSSALAELRRGRGV